MQVCLGASEVCSACPCRACLRRARCIRASPHLTSDRDWGSSTACCSRGPAVIRPLLSRTCLVKPWSLLQLAAPCPPALTQRPTVELFCRPGLQLPTRTVLGVLMPAKLLTAVRAGTAPMLLPACCRRRASTPGTEFPGTQHAPGPAVQQSGPGRHDSARRAEPRPALRAAGL